MTASRNTHRLLALVGVGVFGLLTLVGCGGGGGDGGGSPATPKAWGTAQLIETEDAGDAEIPQIAVDGSGNAIAVWYQHDGTRTNIWANRFSASAWGTAQLIETNNLGDASEPQIAVDGSGNAIAVWPQTDGTRINIWANRFSAGAWGTAQLIETDDAGHARFPQIAVDGSGNAIAVWQQADLTRVNIWANRFSAGAWGTAQLIETNNAGGASSPQIAVDGSGNAIAVWYQFDVTRFNIWANRFSADAWGTAQLIETDAGSAQSPQIAVDGSGNAIAVWRQFDGMRNNIWANRFDAGLGTWDTAELIETDNAGDAFDPQIAVDGSGNAIAVWIQHDSTRFNIWANRFSAGAWSTAQLIETDDAGDAFFPQIEVDGNGNALAVWQQFDGTRDNIWANRFSGGAWGTAQLIETGAASAEVPQIAVDGAGNAIAVWQQSDGTRQNIWANRFE